MFRASSVDEYIEHHEEWSAALEKLRRVLVKAPGLEETVKWGGPCYTVDGKNVIGIGAFKEYVGLWFYQGVHLSDPDGVLVNAQEGKTKALRQWRFTSAREISVARVKVYVAEAIANQKAGKEVRPERGKAVVVPPELDAVLKKKARARKAFEKLTPGKQREYCDHVACAKREATRLSRVEKVLPLIESGVGLNDRYRNC